MLLCEYGLPAYADRWTYTNLTSVAEQVEIIYKHKSLLLWYTGKLCVEQSPHIIDLYQATSQMATQIR